MCFNNNSQNSRVLETNCVTFGFSLFSTLLSNCTYITNINYVVIPCILQLFVQWKHQRKWERLWVSPIKQIYCLNTYKLMCNTYVFIKNIFLFVDQTFFIELRMNARTTSWMIIKSKLLSIFITLLDTEATETILTPNLIGQIHPGLIQLGTGNNDNNKLSMK